MLLYNHTFSTCYDLCRKSSGSDFIKIKNITIYFELMVLNLDTIKHLKVVINDGTAIKKGKNVEVTI